MLLGILQRAAPCRSVPVTFTLPVMKTPQEKKRLSLAKDRRNTFGQNSKASGKGIPLAKLALIAPSGTRRITCSLRLPLGIPRNNQSRLKYRSGPRSRGSGASHPTNRLASFLPKGL